MDQCPSPELVEELAAASVLPRIDRERFTDLFRRAKAELELSDDAAAGPLKVCRITIQRWTAGGSAPYPTVARCIFAVLHKIALERRRAA